MSGQREIVAALRTGPKTNRELQELTFDHGGGVARSCAELRKRGRVTRVDPDRGRGRGSRAVYALVEEARS